MMQVIGDGDGQYVAEVGNKSPHLLTLPNETLLRILRCLHYKDLVRVSLVCERLHILTQDGSLWAWQCQHYYLCHSCPDGLSWKQKFVAMHRDFGKYPCYVEIKQAWDRVETFLMAHCPLLLESLQDGVTETVLDGLEERLHVSLPLDLRLSYRLHNGQHCLPQEFPGIMGGGMIYTHKVSFALTHIDLLESSYQIDGPFAGCAVLAMDTYLRSRQVACLSGVAGYTPGQIYHPCVQESTPEHRDCFIIGTSFTDWFCSYAEKLTQDVGYRVIKDHIYRFYSAPDCVANTCGITVRPTTCFMPELSRTEPQLFFYAYRIIMLMAEDADPGMACRLQTRHWTITNGDGMEEHVQGPGVIGEHPVMRPGAQFDWVSCCTFTTPYGNMRGHFNMTNMLTGAVVEVECPCFHMQAPPILTGTQRSSIVAQLALTKPEHGPDNTQPS